MKAIQMAGVGPPEVLTYVDVERPAPGRGEVLIKVDSISVNYSDSVVRRGGIPNLPALPIIPGGEYCGVVEAVAEDVSTLRPGQSVVAFGNMFAGAYAEYAVARAEKVVPVPAEMDRDEAAAFPIAYLMAYHLLHTVGGITPGQTILLYGAAGGVGSAVIQLAGRAECPVIALAGSPERARYAKTQGAADAILYKTEDVSRRIEKLTGGRGIELVLNSAGGDSFERDFDVLAPFGSIIWFGLADGPPRADLAALLMANFGASKGVTAFTISTVIQHRPELLARSFDQLVRLVLDREIRPHIHDRLPLAEAATAHRLLESSSVYGRIILKP